MIKKVERYILKQEGVSIYKEHESGSVYYKVGSQKIRVSNHQNFNFYVPNVLEVIISGNDDIILIIGGKFAVINYAKFKEFIRTFTFIALYTKPINIPKLEKSVVTGLDTTGLTEKQISRIKKDIDNYKSQNKKRQT